MKKMKFMLPAIFGLAIVTGLAAILLAAISKILIVAGIIGAIITFAARRITRRKQQSAMQGGQGFNQMHGSNDFYYGRPSFYQGDVVPVSNSQRQPGITPIN